MRYATGTAFRQALTPRLRSTREASGLEIPRLWRIIAFERLLARLVTYAPDAWILKGGFALDLRLGNRARSTLDVDLAWLTDKEIAESTLQLASQRDLGDYFVFRIERTAMLDDTDAGGAVRYQVHWELARVRLEPFHIDVGFSAPIFPDPDQLSGTDFLNFSGIEPITVPVVPLAQHVAEKVHAYTRIYGQHGAPSSRVKDLVDLVLIQAHADLLAADVKKALVGVFDARGTHPVPDTLPPPPSSWRVPYRTMSIPLDIPPGLDDGYRLADRLLGPIFQQAVADAGVWSHAGGRWTVTT